MWASRGLSVYANKLSQSVSAYHTLCLLQRLAASGVTMPKSSSKRGVKRDSAQYLHGTPQVVSVAQELAPDAVGHGN